jgi:hypothetical protein
MITKADEESGLPNTIPKIAIGCGYIEVRRENKKPLLKA